jgi:hypothetical protein
LDNEYKKESQARATLHNYEMEVLNKETQQNSNKTKSVILKHQATDLITKINSDFSKGFIAINNDGKEITQDLIEKMIREMESGISFFSYDNKNHVLSMNAQSEDFKDIFQLHPVSKIIL